MITIIIQLRNSLKRRWTILIVFIRIIKLVRNPLLVTDYKHLRIYGK